MTDWKIVGLPILQGRIRALSDADLLALMEKLQEIGSKTLRARRLVRAEIERRKGR